MHNSSAGKTQRSLFLLMFLAATSCGKSEEKQAAAPEASPTAAPATGVEAAVPIQAVPQSQAAPNVQAVPKEAETLAISLIEKYCARAKNPSLECKGYRIKTDEMFPSHAIAVTDADRANGIEDKWCVSVSYIKKQGPSVEFIAGLNPSDFPKTPGTDWRDASATGVYTKRGGAWQYEPNAMCM